MVNRTRDARRGAAETVRRRACVPTGWDETTGLLGGAGLLVNTTTLGMTGQPPLDDQSALPGLAGGRGHGL